jgi:hypothetical protein
VSAALLGAVETSPGQLGLDVRLPQMFGTPRPNGAVDSNREHCVKYA